MRSDGTINMPDDNLDANQLAFKTWIQSDFLINGMLADYLRIGGNRSMLISGRNATETGCLALRPYRSKGIVSTVNAGGTELTISPIHFSAGYALSFQQSSDLILWATVGITGEADDVLDGDNTFKTATVPIGSHPKCFIRVDYQAEFP